MSLTTAETLSSLVGRSLSSQYERVRGKVRDLAGPLSEEQFWRRPFPYGNSVGHLVLHLTGNLSYYIGTQIAHTGYVRDRPKEFADPSRRPKADVLADFDRAVDVVAKALAAQDEGHWGAAFEAVGAEGITDRLSMFVRCAAHADHHAGQMIYLCKQLALGPSSS